ncbi:MAG: SDR family NAD(P)-dependent oxidoreductase [Candidatus Nanopelagicales bacterium]
MDIAGNAFMVTGGASGLGRATAARLVDQGGLVVIVDLAESAGDDVARFLGPNAQFAAADVRDSDAIDRALDRAQAVGQLRGVVNCAGRGGALRLVDRDGKAGSLELFESVIGVNLVGSYNVLRLSAARMSDSEAVRGERGVCVLTSSIAAFEGQIGQVPYASSKAGIVGLTLVSARDLAARGIRVCAIAPGVFDTPILDRVPASTKASLAESVPNPRRLGHPAEFATLAQHVIENGYLNGETIRLDGALRMPPK